jgi:Flp pilus assembly protein TadB
MNFVFSLIAAISLASIPIILGWRSTAGEAAMAKQLGIAVPRKKFDPDRFARQTGTGLAFNQLLFSFLAWVFGGLIAGLFLGFIAAILFAIAGGLLYYGGVSDRRQTFRLQQAKDILRGMGVVETLLADGKSLEVALRDASNAVGPDGRLVLGDLVSRMQAAPADQQGDAIRAWTLAWDNPAVNIVAVCLIGSVEYRISIADLVGKLRTTLADVVQILGRARAAANGIAWQSKFLAIFPPAVLVVMSILTPEAGRMYATQPWYLLPVVVGSSLSYWLSMRSVRNGLSIETSMGLQAGNAPDGTIKLDKMGRVL